MTDNKTIIDGDTGDGLQALFGDEKYLEALDKINNLKEDLEKCRIENLKLTRFVSDLKQEKADQSRVNYDLNGRVKQLEEDKDLLTRMVDYMLEHS